MRRADVPSSSIAPPTTESARSLRQVLVRERAGPVSALLVFTAVLAFLFHIESTILFLVGARERDTLLVLLSMFVFWRVIEVGK